MLTSALDRYYASEAQSNLDQLGIRNSILPTQADVDALYPEVRTSFPDEHFNYVNHEAGLFASAVHEQLTDKRLGWAESTECVKLMLSWCVELGAKVIPGQSMSSTIIENGEAKGIRTEEGTEWRADLIVLAMGSWTESVVDTTDCQMPSGMLTASGQAVVVYQLDEEMQKRFATLPVIMDTGIGWYCFPVRFSLPAWTELICDVANSRWQSQDCFPPTRLHQAERQQQRNDPDNNLQWSS